MDCFCCYCGQSQKLTTLKQLNDGGMRYQKKNTKKNWGSKPLLEQDTVVCFVLKLVNSPSIEAQNETRNNIVCIRNKSKVIVV